MRIRLLHPEFFSDPTLAELDDFTRLVFAGLWLIADRDGRLIDAPRLIDGAILPLDTRSSMVPLQTLATARRIVRYVTPAGQRVIQIVNFAKYQHIHPREKPSQLPPPELLSRNGSASVSAGGSGKTLDTGRARKRNRPGPSASTSTSTSTFSGPSPERGAPKARPLPGAGRTQEQRRRAAPDARPPAGASAPVDRDLIEKHFGVTSK